MRVAAVQYPMRGLKSFLEFQRQLSYYAEAAADYQCQFLLLPELLTLQLLSLELRGNDGQRLSKAHEVERLAQWTPDYQQLLVQLAQRFSLNIIGATHLSRGPDGITHNQGYIVSKTGEMETQCKIHPTPDEVSEWGVQGGDRLQVYRLEDVTFGVLICYDVEFPELARHLVDQGAELLFVPFCTDDRRGYLRVRYCSQARAVENHCYLAMAGAVGCLPDVYNMDMQYAQNLLITPSDVAFARDGILAEGTLNQEEIVIGDFDIGALRHSRRHRREQSRRDRRLDLYEYVWKKKPEGG